MTSPTFYRFAAFATILSALLLPTVSHAAVGNGTLIKGQTSSAVYYVTDGKRYAFPNERVYHSWYWDFSTVQTVSDADLSSYVLSGNVTYRPGMNLIKVTTDPKVYALSRYGTLRWVTTEQVAAQLYGSDWASKVHDVADTFFMNYVVGSPITLANQYDGFGEQASAPTIDQNIRPMGYVAPTSPTSTIPIANAATVVVSVSASQATLNQMVLVAVTVSKSNRPIRSITIWNNQQSSSLATCVNSTTCSVMYRVNTAPVSVRFRATAIDDQGGTIETPAELQAVLNVPAVSTDITMSATPYAITSGSRFNFTSDARKLTSITSHKIFVAIPGEPNPILWKDCAIQSSCNGSTPLWRTSQFFSEILTGGQTSRSASITVSVSGDGIPHPTLTLLSKPSSNQAVLRLDAPSGETIGWSSLVEGTSGDNPAIALCEYSQCEVTVQFSKPVSYTGFTSVGGKLEASNTLYLEP